MNVVVLDTHVLVSGFVNYAKPTSTPRQLLVRWLAGAFTLVVSAELLAEVASTLGKPYFRQRLTQEQIDAAIAALRSQATITPLTVSVQAVAAHPEDDVILATAASAGAEYLVTGDGPFLQLGSYQGITILSPRAFLDRLQAAEAAAFDATSPGGTTRTDAGAEEPVEPEAE